MGSESLLEDISLDNLDTFPSMTNLTKETGRKLLRTLKTEKEKVFRFNYVTKNDCSGSTGALAVLNSCVNSLPLQTDINKGV